MALRSLVLNPPPLEGPGSYTFPDGSHYEGTWANFLPHGTGTFSWQNGTVFTGSFKEGKIDGNGTLSMQNVGKLPYSERGAMCMLTYSGGFSDGRASGQGTITFPLDERRTSTAELQTCFEGSFQDGAASGPGVFRFSTADESGEWSAGELVQESSVRKPVTAPAPATGPPMQEADGGAMSPHGRQNGYAYDDFEEAGSALANGSSEMSPPSMGSIAQRRSMRMGAVEPYYSIGEQANSPLDEEEEARFEEGMLANGEDPEQTGAVGGGSTCDGEGCEGGCEVCDPDNTAGRNVT
jgi:hypothetical protein